MCVCVCFWGRGWGRSMVKLLEVEGLGVCPLDFGMLGFKGFGLSLFLAGVSAGEKQRGNTRYPGRYGNACFKKMDPTQEQP